MSVATQAHPEGVRALAFSDPNGDIWGAAWVPPGSPATALISAGSEAASITASLEGGESSEPWRLELGDTSLVLEGLGDPVEDHDAASGEFDQLCRVTGTVVIGGETRELTCLGWRGSRPPAVLSAEVSSLRQVAAWLGPEDGFSLLALRPARAKGQDTEAVSAAMFSSEESRPVVDPRLSTTYDDSGELVRAGIELWVQMGEDPDQQYPRRAVGESVQRSARWTVEGLALQAQPFHWHAGGREGPGIYLLARRS